MTFKILKLKNGRNLQGLLLFVLMFIFALWHTAIAQDDLVLENMEISTAEIYEAANSITAGSGFTIMSTGKVTFKAGKNVYLRPGFTVLSGGTFNVMLDEIYGPVSEDISEIPAAFQLGQNYPNPFNPSTTINFTIPAAETVTLEVYNSLGQMVGNLVVEQLQAGSHDFEFNAQNLPSGVYYYRLQAGRYVDVKKMILLK